MTLPLVGFYLPEFVRLVEELAKEVQHKQITDEMTLERRVRRFFTPATIDHVDSIIPGWRAMASYADGQTLIHTVTVFAALLMCPEYQQANETQRTLMQWIVLFHDLSKVLIDGKRDPTHSFKSAALAGKLIARFPFETTPVYEEHIAAWVALTTSAALPSVEAGSMIQDNSQLPEIMEGIKRMFGEDTPAALIVKTVLFHQSINVVVAWPQAAPLTELEITRYISPTLLPLLKMMMLVDNDAYAFFDEPLKQGHRAETLAVFSNIGKLLDAADGS